MTWIGLDIGGANIKSATSDGQVQSMPFRFWTEHERLGEALTSLIRSFETRGPIRVAATMTAELADCFLSRQAGVKQIVDCLGHVCQSLSLPAPVFAGTDTIFRESDLAVEQWLATAASNWAMTALFVSRFLSDNSGLLVDMGSTTTDFIPIQNGRVVSKGKTDFERLRYGELVYVGVDRTPVSSVMRAFVVESECVPIARELFATVSDAMLLCGFEEEDVSNCDTADGRPRTKVAAARRLCKMICEDVDPDSDVISKRLAEQVLGEVELLCRQGLAQNESSPANVIVTGSGSEFAMRMTKRVFPGANVSTLGSHVGETKDRVAPAFAVAVLASERYGN